VAEVKGSRVSRRSFVRQTGILAGGMFLGAGGAKPGRAAESAAGGIQELPTTVLGRTGVTVTRFTLGTAPCGNALEPPEIAEIVNLARELGVSSIDTAPAYKRAEEGVGLALQRRPKDFFLATKVMADTVEDAEKSLDKSLALLKTDDVDLVYYHSVGSHDVPKAMEPDGVFRWLVKQKRAGRFRFLGISGHHKPGEFAQLLETGEVDVLLTVVNFVDRHTYNFEEKVLPLARKLNVGIVAMKVFGGARRKGGSYGNPDSPPELDVKHLDLAVCYSLGTPGVATLNLGVHKKEQVCNNIEMVSRFQPLSGEEKKSVRKLGKELAEQWGPHFGPVV